MTNAEKCRAYYQRHREKRLAYFARYRRDNPDRYRARYTLNNRVRQGKIVKPDRCAVCGQPGTIEAHHDNYAKPLDVKWLCKERCHHRADKDDGQWGAC